jgi:hypothetical protein
VDDQKIKLTLEADSTQVEEATKDVVRLEQSLEHVVPAANKADRAMEGTGKGAKQAQQGFLDLSRAASDWATGGFLGVVNNLEGIGRAIPALLKNPMALLSGLPAILTAVGTALYLFGGKVYEAFRHFALGSHEVPKATEALKRNEERIREVVKALDSYREKQRLTNSELKEYNKLSDEQVRLEEQKVKLLETQERMKKFNTQDQSKEADEKQRAEMFADTLGTPKQRQELARSVEKALPREAIDKAQEKLRDALEAQNKNLTEDPFNLVGVAGSLAQKADQARAVLDAATARRKKEAEGLASKATIGGDAVATGRIRQLQEANPDAFNDLQKFAVEDADPAKAREEQQFIERQKRNFQLDKDLKKIDDDKKKKAADDKLADRAALDKAFDDARKVEADEKEKAAKDAEKEANRNAAIQGRQDKDTEKEFGESVKGSGVVSMAASRLAELEADGGASDRFGRFHKMTPEQIRQQVSREVERYLHRQIDTDKFGRPVHANPGMGGEETGLTAARITDMGQQRVNKEMAGLAGQQLNNTQKLLNISAGTANEVNQLRAAVMNQARAIETLERRTRQTSKTALHR